jgi:hypothetical protein
MRKPEHVDLPKKGSTNGESANDTVDRAHIIASEMCGGVVVDRQYLAQRVASPRAFGVKRTRLGVKGGFCL